MIHNDPLKKVDSLGTTGSGETVSAVRIKRSGGDVSVRHQGHFVNSGVIDNTRTVLSTEYTKGVVQDIQSSSLDHAITHDGRSFVRVNMMSSAPVTVSTEAFDRINNETTKSDRSQVSFTLSKDGESWRLSDVKIHRPSNFVTATREHFASDVQSLYDSGMDSVHLRHEVPSSLILRDIMQNVEGKTVEEVHAYLKRNLPEGSFSSIDEGLQKLATLRFNNFDNLWAGDGHQNMSLGNLLHEAYQKHEDIGMGLEDVIFRVLKDNDGNIPLDEETGKPIAVGMSVRDAILNGAADWGHDKDPRHVESVITEINRIISSVFILQD